MAFSFTADCDLGSDLEFIVPVGVQEGSLLITESGDIVNMSNSTIYLYCPAYPDYTFSLSRFSGVTYRSDSGYNSVSLVLSDVSYSPVFTEQPFDLLTVFFLAVCAACCLIVAFFGGAKK